MLFWTSEDFCISSTHAKDPVAIFSRVRADFPDPVSVSLITISNAVCWESPKSCEGTGSPQTMS